MHKLAIVIAVCAAILHGVAYLLYNRQAKLGSSKPNAASWSLWAFLATLNALSYFQMSGDVVASLQFMTGSVACMLTFIYVLFIGKFSRLTPKECALFALGLLAILIWWALRSATSANMIVLLAFLISFKPTLDGVKANPFKESPLPWVLWTIAFSMSTVNVLLSIDMGTTKLIGLITPLVLLICHGAIAFLCRQRRKESFTA